MHRRFPGWHLLCIFLFISGCASSYKQINLQRHSFSKPSIIIDSVYAGYLTNLHGISDNGWYAKKERHHRMVALGVKIDNHSDVSFVMEQAYVNVYVGNERKVILNTDQYIRKVHQRPFMHLLHFLYPPPLSDGAGGVIILPVGAVVGSINFVKAQRANRAHAAQIEKIQVWDKVVPAHGTLYGVILVKGTRYEDYAIRFEVQ
jgi:hypothetical protein